MTDSGIKPFRSGLRARAVLLPLLAIAAFLLFWQTDPFAPDVPAATWRTGSGTEVRQGRNYDEFAAESPVRLSVHCPEPCYFYVFAHSAEDGTILLFPSPQMDSDCDNPLPRGHTVLPGHHDGKRLSWTTRSGIVGLTTFVAVASKTPLPELEELARRLRFWSNTVFPDGAMHVTKSKEGVEVLGPPRSALPHELLLEAADLANEEVDPNGPMRASSRHPGVWLSGWKIRERRKPPKKK